MQQTQKTWVRSLVQEDPREKGMATHCNILAWEIPWTEEPGGLQSTGSQKVRHNLATKYLQGQGRRILCIYNTQQTRTCFFVKLWMLVIES